MQQAKQAQQPSESQHQNNVLSIETPLSVTVARQQIPLAQVLGLTPGTILRFDKPCTEPLSIEVVGKEVAKGQAVKVGERMGVRIS